MLINAVFNLLRYPLHVHKRKIRSKDIQEHGWPPHPLMDSDGDIIHPPEKDD